MFQPLQNCFGAPTVSLFWDIIMHKMADANAQFVHKRHKRSVRHYSIHSDGTKSYNYNNKF